MNPSVQAVTALSSWLKTESGFEYIRKLSTAFVRDSLQEGALATSLGTRISYVPGELQEEIAQEFMEFLFASFLPQLHRRPDQVSMILSDQTGKVLRFALQQFSWRLQDDARKKDVNPRAYLYRRIREVLARDNTFIVHKDPRNILTYSLSAGVETLRDDSVVFTTLDYAVLSVPPALRKGREFLFTAQYISRAALFFQQEITRELNGNYAIPLRELVRYLALHYPWINSLQPDALPDTYDVPLSHTLPEEYVDQITALQSIKALAEQFAQGMDEQSRRIFAWLLDDPPVSLKEIARRLDIPDHNRVYRIQQKTIAGLKKFTSSWPGPPLEDLPDDVGLAFIEAIRNICEKTVN